MGVQYRWVLVLYNHHMEEIDRVQEDVWYDNLEECEKAAEALTFYYCGGYSLEFESRPAQPWQTTQ